MADIKTHLNNIKGALYGKDVRGSIHDGIDAINKEVENTTGRQVDLENTFNQLVINAGNSNAEIVDARVKNDGTSYSKLGDRLDAVDSQLAQNMTKVNEQFNTIGMNISGGVNDTEKLKNALSNFNIVKLNRNYIITDSIEVKENCILDLNGYEILINNNIDGIILNGNSKIINGTVRISTDIQKYYNSSAIVLNSNTAYCYVDCNIINETNAVSNNFCTTGNAIKFKLDEKGSFIVYAKLNGSIKGFRVGINVTVPNLEGHIVGSGYDNWTTQCSINMSISGSNMAVLLNDESNMGRSIHGFDVNVRGQAGWFDSSTGFNEAIFAKCEYSTFNVMLDDCGSENNRVNDFIRFDKSSKYNTYLGTATRVNNLSNTNIILNRQNYFDKNDFLNYKGLSANNIGYLNNILYHANERFTVTTSNNNSSLYNAWKCFEFSENAETALIISDNKQISQTSITIDFGKSIVLSEIAIGLNSRDFRNTDKIHYSFYNNNNLLGSKTFDMKMYNIVNLIRDIGLTTNNVTKINVNFKVDANSGFSNIVINSFYGFGNITGDSVGSLVSKSGGTMYGDLHFNENKSVYICSPNGTEYKIAVNDDGTLKTYKV